MLLQIFCCFSVLKFLSSLLSILPIVYDITKFKQLMQALWGSLLNRTLCGTQMHAFVEGRAVSQMQLSAT